MTDGAQGPEPAPPAASGVTIGDAEPPGIGRGTARNSIVLAAWTLVSRVTGLVRVVVIGAAFGPTYFANSFQASNTVPGLVLSLIAGPVLAMVVVPGLVGALSSGGPPRARVVLGRVMGWVAIVSAAISALLAMAAPVLAWTLTRAIPDPGERSRGWWVSMLFVVLVAPQIVLNCLAYLGSTLGVGLHAVLQLCGAARVGLIAWPSTRWRHDPDALALTRRLTRAVGVATLPSPKRRGAKTWGCSARCGARPCPTR